ncbi:MAG: hypothetical protein E7001_04830 [Coriobacteriaceae bacterium]|nr:hypothetical protein [Coriobacteriaceae bacterium]
MMGPLESVLYSPTVFVLVFSAAVASLVAAACFCVGGALSRHRRLHAVGAGVSGAFAVVVLAYIICLGAALAPDLGRSDPAFFGDVWSVYVGATVLYLFLLVAVNAANIFVARRLHRGAAARDAS